MANHYALTSSQGLRRYAHRIAISPAERLRAVRSGLRQHLSAFIRKRVIRLTAVPAGEPGNPGLIPSFTLDSWDAGRPLHGSSSFGSSRHVSATCCSCRCRAHGALRAAPGAASPRPACSVLSLLHNHLSVVIRNAIYYHLFYRQIILFPASSSSWAMVFARPGGPPRVHAAARPVFASMPAVRASSWPARAPGCRDFAARPGVMLAQGTACRRHLPGRGPGRPQPRPLPHPGFVGGISYEIYLFHLLFYTASAHSCAAAGKGPDRLHRRAVALIVQTAWPDKQTERCKNAAKDLLAGITQKWRNELKRNERGERRVQLPSRRPGGQAPAGAANYYDISFYPFYSPRNSRPNSSDDRFARWTHRHRALSSIQ